jgi:ubiquinone/menaquinone biosynthesis C-methylase UbiE
MESKWSGERGLMWTGLYTSRAILHRIEKQIEKSLIKIETKKFITGDNTVSSSHHTVDRNREIWDSYNWSDEGEEWTKDASYKGLEPNEWKIKLINEMMDKYVQPGSTVLEIGPGAGRWTEHLLKKSKELILADVSEKCLDICKGKFPEDAHIKYYCIGDKGLSFLNDNSVDYIWAYDVFVHINPTDTKNYIDDFSRILRPGGQAIIHHPGEYPNENEEFVRSERFRSYVNKDFFASCVQKSGMVIVEQNDSLAHIPGDIISVFRKPTD